MEKEEEKCGCPCHWVKHWETDEDRYEVSLYYKGKRYGSYFPVNENTPYGDIERTLAAARITKQSLDKPLVWEKVLKSEKR